MFYFYFALTCIIIKGVLFLIDRWGAKHFRHNPNGLRAKYLKILRGIK